MNEEKMRTILCVDDEEDITDSLRDTFYGKYNVMTARDGKEGLKIFNESDIDLIVSDQRMPEMTGVELFTEVNKIRPICKKIMLTGYADIDAARDAINKASVDRYFDKPWDETELLKCAEDLLKELETDEFFESALRETKQLQDDAGRARKAAGLYGRFLDYYVGGICIVGADETIEYVNKCGLEKLKCNNLADIKGKSLTDIFSISGTDREEMKKKYNEKVSSPSKVDIKLCDGQTTSVQACVSFAPDGDGITLTGIIFFD